MPRKRCLLLARGTGPKGLLELRPSPEGAYGPGIYFYAGPAVHKARHYAERNGGVIVAVASPDTVSYHRSERPGLIPGLVERGDIAVAQHADDVRIVGVIPTEQTLDAHEFERALEQLTKWAPKYC